MRHSSIDIQNLIPLVFLYPIFSIMRIKLWVYIRIKLIHEIFQYKYLKNCHIILRLRMRSNHNSDTGNRDTILFVVL